MRPSTALLLLLLAALTPARASSQNVSAPAPGTAFCFGAAGPGCSTEASGGQAVYCRAVLGSSEVECMVHAGSLEHDSCCFEHPNGRGCGRRPEDARYCAHEWSKSQERTRHGLYWTRRLDPREANRSGLVDFDQYCAPSGTVVAAGDERYCCSRSAVALDERDLQGINRLRCR